MDTGHSRPAVRQLNYLRCTVILNEIKKCIVAKSLDVRYWLRPPLREDIPPDWVVPYFRGPNSRKWYQVRVSSQEPKQDWRKYLLFPPPSTTCIQNTPGFLASRTSPIWTQDWGSVSEQSAIIQASEVVLDFPCGCYSNSSYSVPVFTTWPGQHRTDTGFHLRRNLLILGGILCRDIPSIGPQKRLAWWFVRGGNNRIAQ